MHCCSPQLILMGGLLQRIGASADSHGDGVASDSMRLLVRYYLPKTVDRTGQIPDVFAAAGCGTISCCIRHLHFAPVLVGLRSQVAVQLGVEIYAVAAEELDTVPAADTAVVATDSRPSCYSDPPEEGLVTFH